MKTKIIILIILFLSLCSVIASATAPCPTCPQTASASIEARPGSIISLQLKNYELITSGLVITPSWKPAFVKWYLIDPTGGTKYMVQDNLDSVIQVSSGFNTATWSVSVDSGLMKIPAFATQGDWSVVAKLYDVNKVFIIQWSNKAETTLGTVRVVGSSITDSLGAPFYVYINLGGNPITGELEFSFATPDLIFILLIIIVIIIIIINVRASRNRRKEKHA
jgi:hypothetical protein